MGRGDAEGARSRTSSFYRADKVEDEGEADDVVLFAVSGKRKGHEIGLFDGGRLRVEIDRVDFGGCVGGVGRAADRTDVEQLDLCPWHYRHAVAGERLDAPFPACVVF